MKPLKNDIFLRALRCEPTPYTPIWIMRQAGRYLPEYNATRKRAGNFLNLCKTPELATEVTLQPLARFPLDAAIIFSDILTIPDAMGLGLYFAEGEGPKFERPLRDEAAIKSLPDRHEPVHSTIFDTPVVNTVLGAPSVRRGRRHVRDQALLRPVQGPKPGGLRDRPIPGPAPSLCIGLWLAEAGECLTLTVEPPRLRRSDRCWRTPPPAPASSCRACAGCAAHGS